MNQMTHKEFCCWLEGFFMRGGNEPTAEQWHEIGKRLHKTMNPAVTLPKASKGIMDECEQGATKFEPMPKTLQEMMDQVKPGPIYYVSPFVPQAPFIERTGPGEMPTIKD